MKIIEVSCECKKCGYVVTYESKELARDGFKCPKCKHNEYRILL